MSLFLSSQPTWVLSGCKILDYLIVTVTKPTWVCCYIFAKSFISSTLSMNIYLQILWAAFTKKEQVTFKSHNYNFCAESPSVVISKNQSVKTECVQIHGVFRYPMYLDTL